MFFQFERTQQTDFSSWWLVSTPLKNMLVKLDHDFPKHPGVKIPKILPRKPPTRSGKKLWTYPKNQRQKGPSNGFGFFHSPTKSIQVTITNAGPKFGQVLRAIGKTILIPVGGWRFGLADCGLAGKSKDAGEHDAFFRNGSKAIFMYIYIYDTS